MSVRSSVSWDLAFGTWPPGWRPDVRMDVRTDVQTYGRTKYPLHSIGHRPSGAAAQKGKYDLAYMFSHGAIGLYVQIVAKYKMWRADESGICSTLPMSMANASFEASIEYNLPLRSNFCISFSVLRYRA